jgi:hypothetical protein
MSTDEPELRSRLADTAALAGPPRFTAEDLAGRVRRIKRRHKRAGTFGAISVAAAVSAVAIPLTLGGTSPAGTSPGRMSAPGAGPRLSYMVTVNGDHRAIPARTGALPLYTVTSGERLTITVKVTVPERQTLTALWLGITDGAETPANVPTDMKPILAGGSHALRPGPHRFVLHWTVPAGLKPRASRELSSDWAWSDGAGAGAITEFAVPLPARAMAPAAVAHRLRVLALHAVRSCDGAGPAWIHAVRTTFGEAKAIPDVAEGINVAESPAASVYLVLMKGDFIFNDGGRIPPGLCEHGPSGHYYSALFDAATFVTLESGLGDHRFPIALRTLGPVLSLGRSVRG